MTSDGNTTSAENHFGSGSNIAASWRSVGRALTYRNYRLFFFGQAVSMVGTWMNRIASGWLVYRLSDNNPALMLGIVAFVGQSPTFFVAPLAGALVDRWHRHRVIVITQILSALQSLSLAFIAFYAEPGTQAVVQIAALSMIQGILNAFDMPARQAFLVEMVTRKEDLPSAVALLSSGFVENDAFPFSPAAEQDFLCHERRCHLAITLVDFDPDTHRELLDAFMSLLCCFSFRRDHCLSPGRHSRGF